MILNLSNESLSQIGDIVTTWREKCDCDNIPIVESYIDGIFLELLSEVLSYLINDDLDDLTVQQIDTMGDCLQETLFEGIDFSDSDLIADLLDATKESEVFRGYVDMNVISKHDITSDQIRNDGESIACFEDIANELSDSFGTLITSNLPDLKIVTKLVKSIIESNGGSKSLFKKLAKRNNDDIFNISEWSKNGMLIGNQP